MAGSKYIECQSMTMAEFASSPIGTKASFLVRSAEDRFEAAKSIKSACSRKGSLCQQVTLNVLIESDPGCAWLPARLITATITSAGASKKR